MEVECAEGHDNVVILRKTEISPSMSGLKVTRVDTCNCSESRRSTTKRTECVLPANYREQNNNKQRERCITNDRG